LRAFDLFLGRRVPEEYSIEELTFLKVVELNLQHKNKEFYLSPFTSHLPK
jgi:hypothetical protein